MGTIRSGSDAVRAMVVDQAVRGLPIISSGGAEQPARGGFTK